MTLADTVLETLSAWKPDGPGPHALRTAADGSVVELNAERTEAFSSLVLDLSVTTGPAADCPAAVLTERAVRVAATVTGLLEPLTVYEVDAGRSVAVLRSATPTVRGDRSAYHELTLTGTHAATLKRYSVDKGQTKRATVAFPLTHEAIAKLVGDVR